MIKAYRDELKQAREKTKKDDIKNKSKRAQEFVVDITKDVRANARLLKPDEPAFMPAGEYFFTISFLICALVFALTTNYQTGVSPDTTDVDEGYSKYRDLIQKLYPFFQDVHVMIFIGFGFLMTFIKTMSWTALSYNWIISVWALLWAIIFNGFWH